MLSFKYNEIDEKVFWVEHHTILKESNRLFNDGVTSRKFNYGRYSLQGDMGNWDLNWQRHFLTRKSCLAFNMKPGFQCGARDRSIDGIKMNQLTRPVFKL